MCIAGSFIGAGDRGRTDTRSPSRDFKSRASAYSATPAKKMEAPPGFEPGVKDLQSSALPLGYGALSNNHSTTLLLSWQVFFCY